MIKLHLIYSLSIYYTAICATNAVKIEWWSLCLSLSQLYGRPTKVIQTRRRSYWSQLAACGGEIFSKFTVAQTTRNSAIAEGPSDALVSRNSATTNSATTICVILRLAVFTARRLAKRGICRRRVSVCLSVCLCVCLSHSGIVSKRLNLGSRK